MAPPTPRPPTRSPSPPRPWPLAPEPGPGAMALHGRGRLPPQGQRARDDRPQGDGPGARGASRRASGRKKTVVRERTETFTHHTYESRRRSRSRDGRPRDANDASLMSGANGGGSPRAPRGAAPQPHPPGDECFVWSEGSRAGTEPEFHDRLRRRNRARGLAPDDDGWREQAERCRPQDGGPARRDDLIYVVKTVMVKEK